MRGADVISTHNDREGLISRRFQLFEDPVKTVRFESNDSRRVLCQDPLWGQLSSEAQEIRPEPSLVRRAASFPSDRRGLTRRASDEGVNVTDSSSNSVPCEGLDVPPLWDVRPMDPEPVLAGLIKFDLSGTFPSSIFKSLFKSAYTAERR